MGHQTHYPPRLAILFAVLLVTASAVVYLFQLQDNSRKSAASDTWALYWDTMQRSLAYERQGRYEQAIAGYRSAMPYAENLPPSLSGRAMIAIHNRIGACYMRMGEARKALEAFEVSARMGDTQYAPQKISDIAGSLGDRQKSLEVKP